MSMGEIKARHRATIKYLRAGEWNEHSLTFGTSGAPSSSATVNDFAKELIRAGHAVTSIRVEPVEPGACSGTPGSLRFVGLVREASKQGDRIANAKVETAHGDVLFKLDRNGLGEFAATTLRNAVGREVEITIQFAEDDATEGGATAAGAYRPRTTAKIKSDLSKRMARAVGDHLARGTFGGLGRVTRMRGGADHARVSIALNWSGDISISAEGEPAGRLRQLATEACDSRVVFTLTHDTDSWGETKAKPGEFAAVGRTKRFLVQREGGNPKGCVSADIECDWGIVSVVARGDAALDLLRHVDQGAPIGLLFTFDVERGAE